MYVTDFQVSGRRGSFPFDMLRYDSCYPASQRDVDSLMQASVRPDLGETCERAFVTLRSVHQHKDDGVPTVERWRSFGWTVTLPSIRTWKV